jgi:hypothetical protein
MLSASKFRRPPTADHATIPAGITHVILGVHEITGEPFVLIKCGYRKRAVLMTG